MWADMLPTRPLFGIRRVFVGKLTRAIYIDSYQTGSCRENYAWASSLERNRAAEKVQREIQ